MSDEPIAAPATAMPIAASEDTALPSRWARIRGWGDWAGENVFLCWAYVTIVMMVLAVVSVPIGIHAVGFSGALDLTPPDPVEFGAGKRVPVKEVGYLFALNWAPYSVLVIPLMMVFVIRLWRCMPETLRAVASAGVLRSEGLARLDPEQIASRWQALQRRCIGVFALIFVCVLAFMLYDWWDVVARPILFPDTLRGLALSDPSMEFDWSIACRYPEANVSCVADGVFGAVAYVLIAGLSTAIAFASCITAVLFVVYVCGVSGSRADRFHHVAMPCGGKDQRGGFEHFEAFFG
ncbi:MAG: hypothetical protein EON96_11745, partial [Caulobacteraceae bacterium]